MNKKKKKYQKPILEEVKMLEVGAALCCKTTVVTCSSTDKSNSGKGQRTSATS